MKVKPSTSPRTVRAIPAEGHNLVPALTSFVGRAADIDDIRRLARAGHVVTVVGPGGMGKTRLVAEVGLQVAPEWSDGVWFVDLSTVTDERRVVTAIADAIGETCADGDDTEILALLERRRLLLLLDNCEHVIAAAARLVDRVLARCPGVGVLATSRVPLALQAEEVWRIESLPTRSESVQLFVDRARTRMPGYELSAGEEEVVAEICDRLDGLPLAIELAAARLAVLSPAEILKGLDRRFGLLRTNDPSTAPRMRSMKALIDWGRRCSHRPSRPSSGGWRSSAPHSTSTPRRRAPASLPSTRTTWPRSSGRWPTNRSSSSTAPQAIPATGCWRPCVPMPTDRLRETEEGAAARSRLATHYLARFPWQRVTSTTGLGGLALEVDTIAPLIDGLLDDGRSDDALALARLASVSRTVDGHLMLALDDLEHAIERADPSSGMLPRALVGAVLLSSRVGDIERAEAHLLAARRSVEQVGADRPLGAGVAGRAPRRRSPSARAPPWRS